MLHAKVFAAGAWLGVAVLGACGMVVLWNGHWLGMLQFALFFGSSAYLMTLDRMLPNLFKFLFVLAAIINAVGWIWDEYTKIVWYDEFAHFYTSFSITLALAYLIYRRAKSYLHERKIDYFLVVISFGLALGAVWEVFEWIILLGDFKDSPVSDIIYDGAGAILAALLAVWLLPRAMANPQKRPAERVGEAATDGGGADLSP